MLLVRRQQREVCERDGERLWRMDELEGLTIERGEGGAQRFVTRDEVVEALFQCSEVQLPAKANGGRNVISRVARV